jgi:hypothetical protein
MTRLPFRISASIRRWYARRYPTMKRFRMMNLSDYDERPRGPGWFDSSWDLGQGLETQEVQPGEPGFALWIEAMTRDVTVGHASGSHDAACAHSIEFVIDEREDLAPRAPTAPCGTEEDVLNVADPELDATEWAPPAIGSALELELVPI